MSWLFLTHRWGCGLCRGRFRSARELRLHVSTSHVRWHLQYIVDRGAVGIRCTGCREYSPYCPFHPSFLALIPFSLISDARLGEVCRTLPDVMVHLCLCILPEVKQIWPAGSQGNYLISRTAHRYCRG